MVVVVVVVWSWMAGDGVVEAVALWTRGMSREKGDALAVVGLRC